jgi:hypothetical protein
MGTNLSGEAKQLDLSGEAKQLDLSGEAKQLDLSGEAKQLVLDFSITHPVLAARPANGTLKWNDKV